MRARRFHVLEQQPLGQRPDDDEERERDRESDERVPAVVLSQAEDQQAPDDR